VLVSIKSEFRSLPKSVAKGGKHMQCLVAINSHKKESIDYKSLGNIKFGSVDIELGMIELEQPYFDVDEAVNKDYVLLKVNAFSCNYRDKSLLLVNYNQAINMERVFVPFGSEFSAEVMVVGANVSEYKVGDRVMADCAYPKNGVDGLLPGVSTNFASLGWLRIHKRKLIRIPDDLNSIQAASFALGAQTASAMIRISGILVDGGNSLVFSARSTTSQFIIQQLISYGFEPVCVSTTNWSEEELQKIYPARVERIETVLKERNNYNITHVFDPFFDLNVERAVRMLQIGGKYITCGLQSQHPLISESSPTEIEPITRNALVQSIEKNVSLIGNCLGTTEDLKRACNLQVRTKVGPIIDKEYTIMQGKEFLERSFFDKNRFGKCVLNYGK
jgi:NADPH:quinone reductase-like Zn-dependent oxidoreductase